MPVQVMPASFDELADASKSAARNQRLVDACDVLVAFWDGASKGTRATVDRALDSGKEVHVFVANLTGFMAVALAVRVRFFARLREQAGTDSESVEVERGSTVADVYDALRKAHPALDPNRESVRVAVNQEFGDWDVIVAAGDEIAFIPPVSGGAHAVGVLFEITTDPLDARRIEASVAHSGAGAICTFTGIVRDTSRGRSVTHLEYEAYAEMATAEMRKIAVEIAQRWPEARVAMAHRTGRLEIGEASVAVSVSSPHPAEPIHPCRWGIAGLKAPRATWKTRRP